MTKEKLMEKLAEYEASKQELIAKTFAEEILKRYAEELDDIVLASTKVRGV